MSKKVSIVIITYNQQEFVHETIESCLNQTYSNIEIIISDDGSVDNTQGIIKGYADRYPDKIIPVFHPVNTGIAENTNRGLKIVNGDYIIWFGGDDIMLPDKVRIQVEYLEDNPEFSGCYHDADVFEWPSGRILGLFSRTHGSGKFEIIDIKKYLHPKCVLLPSTTMFRREAMGDRLIDVRIKMMNDYLFYAQLLIHGGSFGFVKDSLVKYRVSSKSVCKSEEGIQFGLEELLVTLAILEAKYPDLSRMVEKRTRNTIFHAAAAQIKIGNIERFKSLCFLGMSRGAFFRGLILCFLGKSVISFLYNNQTKYQSVINFFKRLW